MVAPGGDELLFRSACGDHAAGVSPKAAAPNTYSDSHGHDPKGAGDGLGVVKVKRVGSLAGANDEWEMELKDVGTKKKAVAGRTALPSNRLE